MKSTVLNAVDRVKRRMAKDISLSRDEIIAAEMMTGFDYNSIYQKINTVLKSAYSRSETPFRYRYTTVKQLIRYFNIIGWRCVYCGIELDLSAEHENNYAPYTFTVDHIVPLKHRGSSNLQNLACACHYCNHYKDSLPVSNFLAMRNQSEEEFRLRMESYYQGYLNMCATGNSFDPN